MFQNWGQSFVDWGVSWPDTPVVTSQIRYVSPNGNDANNGITQETAWKTIAKVNASTFANGQSILFEGGQTFSGSIVAPSGGESGWPITFGSYGTGRATISSGNSKGFSSINFAGMIVRDLIFVGTASTNDGIRFDNNLGGVIHLPNIQVINCSVSGYGQNGVLLTGNSNSAGFDDVLIDGCTIERCCNVTTGVGSGSAGIYISAGYGLALTPASCKNVTIRNCTSNNNPGASDTNWTGSGIVISNTDGGLIYNCSADNNGAHSAGTVGIWTFDSTKIVIDSCSSTNTKTLGGDGDGFDLDGGCIDCTIKNCYSEGNYGCGYLLFAYIDGFVTNNENCSVVNCVSVNDGRVTVLIGAGVTIGGGFNLNVSVHGNTIYQDSGPAGVILVGGALSGEVYDNTIIITDGKSFIQSNFQDNPDVHFACSNRYLAAGDYTVEWNGVTYTSLEAWQAATGQVQCSHAVVSDFPGHQWNAFFRFDNARTAQNDPVVGPYLTATTGLFPLTIYDLDTDSVTPLSGYWCTAIGSYPIPENIFLQTDLQFLLDWQNEFVPGISCVILNNLVPPGKLAKLQIVASPLTYANEGLH